MKDFSNARNVKFTFAGCLFIWMLVNIIQSIYTNLGNDEAYYWMYAQHLAFGYFDHPPMIALFIKSGTALLTGELGVRVVTILSQLITLFFIWKIIDHRKATSKNVMFFFGLCASVFMFHALGFIATPDSPLLLFTALLLFIYKNMIESHKWRWYLLFSITCAGIVYSKYQGGLVIILLVLSNVKLLKDYRFWLMGLLALFLFIPHILWQRTNDFISFKYQIVDSAHPFSIHYLLEYIPNQMASFNPFFLGLFVYIVWKVKPSGTFERALYFISIGMPVFFFFTTFQGHAEPHWTIAASVPMIILVYKYSVNNLKIKKYSYRFLFPTIILLLVARVMLTIDNSPIQLEFNGQEKRAQQLHSITKGYPVVFLNSYQRPSTFIFYTHAPATTINSTYYRKNQYDIWGLDKEFYGKKAAIISYDHDSFAKTFKLSDGKEMYVHFTDKLITAQRLQVQILWKKGKTIERNKEVSVPEVGS